MMLKTLKMTETLARGDSFNSTRWELCDEYHHDRVYIVFKNIGVLVLWMKVALALEGLNLESKIIIISITQYPPLQAVILDCSLFSLLKLEWRHP